MPAAVIGGIIAAGGALGSAAIVSHSAGKAADQQAAAGEKALALQRDIYNQQQLNEAPWRNTGAAAITTLGGLLGLPSGGGGTGQLPASNAPAQGFDAPISPGQANFAGYTPSGGYLGKDVPMAERMSNPYASTDAGGYTAQQHGASTGSSYGNQSFGQAPVGPPMLKVKAPNGQIYQVPADKQAEAVQNGGTVLGRA